MAPQIRRIVLGVGAALLVGGWGTTRYADEQQQTISITYDGRMLMWKGEEWGLLASKTIYAAGVLSMALGAGLIGFAIPRPHAQE